MQTNFVANMFKITLFSLLMSLQALCQSNDQIPKYYGSIGDIKIDPERDNKDFHACYENYIFQYFNNGGGLEFEGEKIAIDHFFFKNYNPENTPKESGLIRIQFVVNCKGESGRFRILGMDPDYHEKTFDASITNQLLDICKNLKGWKTKTMHEHVVDYYQYLIFKIENGQLKEILP